MTKTLLVECPHCGASQVWDTANIYRPFCSASCKNNDFIAWANEEQTIAGDSLRDDLMSDDLERDY